MAKEVTFSFGKQIVRDFAPRVQPPDHHPTTPARTSFDDLPFRDFAPRVSRADTKIFKTEPRTVFDPFAVLEHGDRAPKRKRSTLYFEPDSPLVENWRLLAVCRGKGDTPEGMQMFYPGPGGAHSGKKYCAVCPVQRECGNEADSIGEEWGIWGGEIRHRTKNESKVA